MESLLPQFNFTFEIFPSTGGDSGKLASHGFWTGVVGDILDGRADIGLSTSYNLHRYTLIGFSRGTQYAWDTFVIGPPQTTYSWQAMFWPFALDLWIGIAISLFLVLITLRTIQRSTVDIQNYKDSIL